MAAAVAWVQQLQPELSPTMTSAVRALASLLILLALAGRNPRALLGDGRPALWLRGLFGGTSLLAYFVALGRVGIGEASFLHHASAFWVVLLAPLVLGERSGRATWLAVIGAMAGMAMLSLPRAEASTDDVGRFAGALSGLLAAGVYLSIRRAGATNSALTIAFYFGLVASVLCLGLLAFEPWVPPRGGLVWAGLGAVGALATFGQLCMTRAFSIGPTTSMASMSYSAPVFTALLGWVLLGQRPDPLAWAGMALILACGVALPFLTAPPASDEPVAPPSGS